MEEIVLGYERVCLGAFKYQCRLVKITLRKKITDILDKNHLLHH